MALYRNRIVGYGEVDPALLLANPGNFRRHPGQQRDVLRGILGEVGWVQGVVVNRTTGRMVDGHARVEEALRAQDPTVPVAYVELTAEEEALVLAVMDRIGAMAEEDPEALVALLADMDAPADAALRALLGEMGGDAMLDGQEAPAEPEAGGGEAWEVTVVCTSEAHRSQVVKDLLGHGYNVKD